MEMQRLQVEFDKLSESDKLELQQSLSNEMQKAKIQECAPYPNLPLFPPIPPTLPISPFPYPQHTYTHCLCRLWKKELTPSLNSSRARAYRHMLEEVRDGGDIVEQFRQKGGAVHAELRGSVPGYE